MFGVDSTYPWLRILPLMQETGVSPLGETLRRARLSRGTTFEEAERVTRIPRKYLEALENENFGILPAPVFARGFLRSYASYLGLDAGDLLPFFPVGHVEEPRLENLPEVAEQRTWNLSGLVAMGVVGFLVLIVIALYSLGGDNQQSPFITETFDQPASDAGTDNNGVQTGSEPGAEGGGPVTAGSVLPELVGQSVETAVQLVTATGATPVIVGIRQGDAPINQVVSQSPDPGVTVGPGDTVTIRVSR
jgi:cytoskeletal protein RodZ